jgi:hypothetical protein
MTRPCCGCGRTYLTASALLIGGRPSTGLPRPGARCAACQADGVFPCRCGHPAHRGGCPRCDCRSNRPDTSVDRDVTGGRRRNATPATSNPQLELREEIR